MAIQVTTPPASEPLSIDEAKLHLRQDLSADDDLITAAIVAARTYCENYTRLKFITQSVTITRTGFAGALMPLNVGPVQGITSVSYKQASDGVLTPLAADQYQLVKSVTPNCLAPAYGVTWPTVRSDYDSVQIVLSVGFGAASTDVPFDLLQAVRLMLGHFYENRAEEVTGTIVSKVTTGAHRLMMPHVLHV